MDYDQSITSYIEKKLGINSDKSIRLVSLLGKDKALSLCGFYNPFEIKNEEKVLSDIKHKYSYEIKKLKEEYYEQEEVIKELRRLQGIRLTKIDQIKKIFEL
jgi:hypothetical protein